MGANSKWALIEVSPFSASAVCVFCNKTINGNNKTQGGGGVRVGAYLSLSGRGWGWALIRGWALINFFCL